MSSASSRYWRLIRQEQARMRQAAIERGDLKTFAEARSATIGKMGWRPDMARTYLKDLAKQGYTRREVRKAGGRIAAKKKFSPALIEARKAWAARRIEEGALEAPDDHILTTTLIEYFRKANLID